MKVTMSEDQRRAAEALRADLHNRDAEHQQLAAFWESLDRPAQNQILLAEYRCKQKRKCLLLHAFRLPAGRFFYKPRYELSPERTAAEPSPSARAKRTIDGDRKWRSRAGSLDEIIEFFSHAPQSGGLGLDCDHIRSVLATASRLDADTSGTPGPQRRPILWG